MTTKNTSRLAAEVIVEWKKDETNTPIDLALLAIEAGRQQMIKEIGENFGSYTLGLIDKKTGKQVKIFHGISMTVDDWNALKEGNV